MLPWLSSIRYESHVRRAEDDAVYNGPGSLHHMQA